MQKIRRRRLGEILVSEGLLTHEQLNEAIKEQKESGLLLGEMLLTRGVVTENDIVRAICIQYQLPFIRPTSYEIEKGLVDKFEVEFLYRNRILPLDRIGDTSLVALGDIPSEEAEHLVSETLTGQIFYYFSPVSEVEKYLKAHFSLSQEQVIAYNTLRSGGGTGASAPPPAAAGSSALLETLDSSWEAIFDEAENNITQ